MFDDPDTHEDPERASESESDDGGTDAGEGEDGDDDGDEDPAPLPDPPSPPEPGPAGCEFDLVWPTTGTDATQTLVHDAYGPRLLAGSYDWHGGIDLPGHSDDEGFHDPVHAVADGSIYAIGNRPNPGQGALSGFGTSAGNVIILEHTEADLHPGAQTLYSLYLHLDTLELDSFAARLADDDAVSEIDLREYYYLGGSGTTPDNRGRRRPTFKSSGDPITAYPRVRRQDQLAIIGDTGATFEHLHFEIRASSPYSADARNPFAYLPHLDETQQSASLSLDGEVVHALIEIPREPGTMGSTTDLSQQLDVETIALQIRDMQGELVDELRFGFHDLAQFEDLDQPQHEIEGVELTISPEDFDSSSASWRLTIEFAGLSAAGLSPGPGEVYSLEVTDLCGNRFTTGL